MDFDIYWHITVCVFLILIILIAYQHYTEYKKSTGGKPITVKLFLAYCVFISLVPIIITLILILALYCRIISLILRIKYRSKFGGLLEGTDAIHTLDRDDVSKNVGNILFIINYQNENFYDTIRQAIVKRFAETYVKTPKLWYTWHEFSGYTYYLKNQVTVEDCVRKLENAAQKDEEQISKTDLLNLLSKYSNTALPKDHTALWEVLVGTQPVKWKTEDPNDFGKYFPVVLRIHHCLSDATQLLKGFVRIFGDVKAINIETSEKLNSDKNKERSSIRLPTHKAVKITSRPVMYLWDTLKLIVKTIYIFLMIPPILLVQGMIKAADKNVLHGPSLSGEKHLVFGVEESPHYIRAIKRIKSRIPGTAFSEVLLAAVTASFSEYFQKIATSVPDTVAAMVPVFPGSSKLSQFSPHKHDVKKIVCRNKFSLAVLNLPVGISSKDACGKCNAINKRLDLVKQQSTIFKNSIDFQMNYLILSGFVGLIPLSLRKILSKRYHTTFMISIVPAPSALTILGGYPIKDVVFWVPNRGPIGMGFSIFSYDGRFQIGLIVDKALIPNQKDVQNIVDGIYKYLDLMNVETDCSRV